MEKPCLKWSYSTKEFAEEDIAKIAKTKKTVKPTRAYLCLKCNTWHITSSPINSNVLNRYFSQISSLNLDINYIKAQNRQLNEQINKASNSYIQIGFLKCKQECKKHKKVASEYKGKYIKKCNEFNHFKNEVNKLILQLEKEREVKNG